ncbi:UROD/MetE-like protein [Daedaleopsis nitida]|nr:UROD/MetE-like protein [Daedaleopsis nitida]
MFPRAEHIGSLKRPDILLQKRADFKHGKCTAEELRGCEEECIAAAVKMQLDLGFQVITDGEFRRLIFHDGIFDKLAGLKMLSQPPTYMFQGRIRRTVSLYGQAFDSLKKFVGPENVDKIKITMGAPEWYHFRHGKYTYEPTVYTNDADYFADIARVYREEIQDLYVRGCRMVQIDDPVLGCFCDQGYRERMVQAGVDPDTLLDTYVSVLNECVRDRPAGMIAGVHICRGNVKPDGSRFTRGPYDYIARKVLTGVKVDRFYLEYDSDDSGGFEPLRFLPRNKRVVLGLVSTKTPTLEDPEVLRRRIMHAADVIAHGEVPRTREEALDQLSISPQCGFASHSRGFAFITEEDVVKKLALVRDVARMMWGHA